MAHEKSKEPAYDSWADYYDIADRDRRPFIEFYRSLLTAQTRSLLDLGCGTGAITATLSDDLAARGEGSSGIRIVGVDESPEMLRIARTREGHIEWMLGDIRSPPVEGTFDLVICCFNTLQFLSEEGLSQTLTAVRRLIGTGGIFAFDIYQPNVEYITRAQTNRLARSVTDPQGRRLEVREDTRYDPSSRVLAIDWRMQEEGKPHAPPLTSSRFHLRQIFAADISRHLVEANLTVLERYGDLDRSPLTKESKRQVLVCGPG